jgi:hypothetical protein
MHTAVLRFALHLPAFIQPSLCHGIHTSHPRTQLNTYHPHQQAWLQHVLRLYPALLNPAPTGGGKPPLDANTAPALPVRAFLLEGANLCPAYFDLVWGAHRRSLGGSASDGSAGGTFVVDGCGWVGEVGTYVACVFVCVLVGGGVWDCSPCFGMMSDLQHGKTARRVVPYIKNVPCHMAGW